MKTLKREALPIEVDLTKPEILVAVGRGIQRTLKADGVYVMQDIHGHSHPAIVDAAQRQLAEGQQAMSMASPVRTELIERLSTRIPGLTRVMLGASGSEATETALKLARRATGKPGVLAFAASIRPYALA